MSTEIVSAHGIKSRIKDPGYPSCVLCDDMFVTWHGTSQLRPDAMIQFQAIIAAPVVETNTVVFVAPIARPSASSRDVGTDRRGPMVSRIANL